MGERDFRRETLGERCEERERSSEERDLPARRRRSVGGTRRTRHTAEEGESRERNKF